MSSHTPRVHPDHFICVCVCVCVSLRAESSLTLCDPMAIVCQAPLSTGFPRQEYWSGVHLQLQWIFLLTQGLNPGLLFGR